MILYAENFRAYATVDDLALAYDYFNKSGILFNEVNGRRIIENTGLLSMKIAPTKKLCLRMIVSMATGTVASGDAIAQLAFNPPGIDRTAWAYNGTSNARLVLSIRGGLILATRAPYKPDGTLTGTAVQIANQSVSIAPTGKDNLVEVMIDESGATQGRIVVRFGGVELVDKTYNIAQGGYPCDAGFGYFTMQTISLGSGKTRGRYGDVVLYTDDADTPWPLGNVVLDYLPAAGLPATVTTAAAEYALADLPAQTGQVLGAVARARMAVASGTQPTTPTLKLVDANGQALAQVQKELLVGAANIDARTLGVVAQASTLNGAKIRIEKG